MMGCGFQAGEQGVQRRPQRGAAGRHRPSRPRHDGQPLLRVLAADDPDGLPRDQGRRGRPVHRRRHGGRVALPGRRAVGVPPQAQRLRGLALRRLHPDGQHGRERRRALQGQPRGAGRVGRDLPAARGRRARRRPLRRRDRRRSPRPTAPRSPRDDGPRARHDGREARRAQAGLQARRRHRHRRQRLPAQRRRRRGARDVRGAARRSSASSRAPASSPPSVAAIRPEIMGLGPIPAVKAVLEQARHDDRRHRRARAQRGVRRPGRARAATSGASTPRSSTRSAARSRSATRSA